MYFTSFLITGIKFGFIVGYASYICMLKSLTYGMGKEWTIWIPIASDRILCFV